VHVSSGANFADAKWVTVACDETVGPTMPEEAAMGPESDAVSTATGPLPAGENVLWAAEMPAYGKCHVRRTPWWRVRIFS